MLNSTAISALNHLLAQADWARARLREHEGAVADVALGAVALRLGVAPDGYFCDAAADATASVTITVEPSAITRLPEGMDAAMSQVKLGGQADFADALSFVFRHLRWDAEADLARLFGPIIGRRLHLGAQAVGRAVPEAGRRLGANASEFLAHEGGMLVPQPDFAEHGAKLRELRDAIGRLDKRVKRLTQQHG